jgi:CHAT domain-containing protein
VPSVSLWLRWKSDADRRGDPALPAAALALADPELAGVRSGEARRAADPWMEGLRLGPLPRARTEARTLVRRIGRGSRMIEGGEVTELLMKETDFRAFGIVHFATHTVVDYGKPDRSAIVLAPGAEEEDGFLQAREIADLDLEGQVVFLSSCRSASGPVFRGEGVLGLARAFFRAGARAVVGNLWPLRDEDAEAFMDEFSRRIASGQSLASALTGARRARIAAGASATAWAGIILVGDGDVIPVPGGRAGGPGPGGWILLAALLVALAILVPLVRRRRTRSTLAPPR